MTEREALYATILAAPDDDLPRLVFADWLDEHGEPERAAHIRAQVELSRLVEAAAFDADEYEEAASAMSDVTSATLWEFVASDGLPIGRPAAYLSRDSVGDLDWLRDPHTMLAVGLRRGVVERFRCPAAFWVESAAQAVANAPIRRVGLTDCEPFHLLTGEWMWLMSDSLLGESEARLPPSVFERLKGADGPIALYPSREAAEDALSDACLAYARDRLQHG